mgnify:CR=1 FL=1
MNAQEWLEELLRLSEAATPGPWEAWQYNAAFLGKGGQGIVARISTRPLDPDDEVNKIADSSTITAFDAAYIVAACNAVPRDLTWTDAPPKEPGWYWFRNGGAKPVILSITLPVKWKAEPDDGEGREHRHRDFAHRNTERHDEAVQHHQPEWRAVSAHALGPDGFHVFEKMPAWDQRHRRIKHRFGVQRGGNEGHVQREQNDDDAQNQHGVAEHRQPATVLDHW